MLFSFQKNRLKPRKFTYIPQTFDPEKEKSREEKFNFNSNRRFAKKKKKIRRQNPSLFILLAIIAAALIWYLDRVGDTDYKAGELEVLSVEEAVKVEENANTNNKNTVPEKADNPGDHK